MSARDAFDMLIIRAIDKYVGELQNMISLINKSIQSIVVNLRSQHIRLYLFLFGISDAFNDEPRVFLAAKRTHIYLVSVPLGKESDQWWRLLMSHLNYRRAS